MVPRAAGLEVFADARTDAADTDFPGPAIYGYFCRLRTQGRRLNRFGGLLGATHRYQTSPTGREKHCRHQ